MKEPPCLLEEDDSGRMRKDDFLMNKSGWIKKDW